ncbi:hypothetical protein T02_7885 [Trichinella nativa]|uniref:Uncharacterized protein n=1 Tax=Trichinella nativa TaxID=6335 RepID=A0A0V1LNS6_9BILA|nr:hypothetical protein T02_5022 [Trichinella nativa]KRZ61139.1 hypothetical protein T02_7885 [Trichinella nativa]
MALTGITVFFNWSGRFQFDFHLFSQNWKCNSDVVIPIYRGIRIRFQAWPREEFFLINAATELIKGGSVELVSFLLLLRNNRWKRLNLATRGLTIFFTKNSRTPRDFVGGLRPDEKTLRMLFCNSLISTMAIPVASLIRSHDIMTPVDSKLWVFHKQLYLSLEISSVGRSTNASGASLAHFARWNPQLASNSDDR